MIAFLLVLVFILSKYFYLHNYKVRKLVVENRIHV